MRVLCIYFLSGIECASSEAESTGASITAQKSVNHSLQKIAEACLRFSPLIAIGNRSIFLEIGACNKLYSEESILLRSQILMERFQCRVQVAIADDIPSSLAFGKYGVSDKNDLPVEALKIYASPFRKSTSLDSVLESLYRLGIYWLKDIFKIPRSSIASRLGKEALLALHAVDNAESIPWPKWKVQERIIEQAKISDEIHILDLQPLLFLLKTKIDQTLLRLKGRGELVSSLQIEIEQEPFTTVKNPLRKYLIEFAFPQGSIHSILPIVQDRLSSAFNHEPLESSVRRVSVCVVKSVSSQGRQRDFFSKREEELESFYSIVSRLIDRLGRERAFVASSIESYYPERSWKKAWSEKSDIAIKVLMPDGLYYSQQAHERPLRVLKEALALRKHNDFYLLGSRSWQIKKSYGPERLSGEWWLKTEDNERDYYRVLTETGEELWVYLQRSSGQFFLQGFFD